MRDLLELIKSFSIPLTEGSRGLLYREVGDKFFSGERAQPTQILIFNSRQYFPGQPGMYETHEEMLAAYQELEIKLKNLTAVNKPISQMRAFAVLTLTDEANKKPVSFARFFKEIKQDMTGQWKNNDIPGGFQLDKATSLKASYALKPNDIFPGSSRFPNVSALFSAFSASPKAKGFVSGMEMLFLPDPKLPIFTAAGEFYTAIRDDLGEIIGPVALLQGLNVGDGATAADQALTDGKGFSGSSIAFPSGKNYGLVDSYIVTRNGVEIGISSKGEKGATASIKNIGDGINFVRKDGTPTQKKMLTTYADQIQIVSEITHASVIDFPLHYAMKRDYLTIEAAAAIKTLIGSGVQSLEEAEISPNVAVELTNLMSSKPAKTHLPNYGVGYHALSAVARYVADEINSDPVFGEACLKFLNSSPIIQLHMSVKKSNDNDVRVTGFTSKYPPNFKGTVQLDPGKTYSSTAASGRLSFAYLGFGEKLDSEPEVPQSKPISDKEFRSGAEKVAAGGRPVNISEPRGRRSFSKIAESSRQKR